MKTVHYFLSVGQLNGVFLLNSIIYVTWWGHHSLPLLEEACLETVPRAEIVGLVPRHEFLHGLQDDTQL